MTDRIVQPSADLSTPTPLELPRDRVDVWVQARASGERSEPALRALLGRYLGQPAEGISLRRAAQGRIELGAGTTNPRGIAFGVSHSHERMALAFARELQPGIDVERMQPRPRALELARRFFPEAEANVLSSLSPRRAEHTFYRLWTAREAIVKAMGRGIAFGLHRLRFDLSDPDLPRLVHIEGDDVSAWQLHQRQLPAIAQGDDSFAIAIAWRGQPRTLHWSNS